MTTRRRTTPPVPMSPVHRRSWRSLWRRCSCGLKEPCIDRLTTSALYLPTDQPPPPPSPPVQDATSASIPGGAVTNVGRARAGEYTPAYLLDRTPRQPGPANVRRSVSARVPVPQPGRAGNLTPAQTQRADHAHRRDDVPTLRAPVPGRANGSGPPQSPPHHPQHNRPGQVRNWAYDGRRVSDRTS
jgi:hypothetical protein